MRAPEQALGEISAGSESQPTLLYGGVITTLATLTIRALPTTLTTLSILNLPAALTILNAHTMITTIPP